MVSGLMGSFIGHVIGVFFSILGYWWAVHMLIRYFRSLCNPGRTFKGSPLFNLRMCGKNVPVEAIAILFFSTCGYLGELVFAPLHAHSKVIGGNNFQHSSCYMFFTLAALAWIGLECVRVLPRKTLEDAVYALLVMAFAVEGLVFSQHLDGRISRDVRFHTLQMYAFLLTALATLGESMYRGNIICCLARPLFMVLQGTWLTHMGFVLYPPLTSPWHVQATGQAMSHREGMIITSLFVLHLVLIAASLLLLAVGLGLAYRRRYPALDKHRLDDSQSSLDTEHMVLLSDDPNDPV